MVLILQRVMNISELQPKQGNVELEGEIVEKEDAREFEKFGKPGKVCNAILKDTSGTVKLTLWNEQIDTVSIGDKIKITNGWVSEWQREKQLSAGKFGKIEVMGSGTPQDTTTDAFVTNDPQILNKGTKSEEDNNFIEDELE